MILHVKGYPRKLFVDKSLKKIYLTYGFGIFNLFDIGLIFTKTHVSFNGDKCKGTSNYYYINYNLFSQLTTKYLNV